MADYTRNLPGDVFNVTTVDNNAKAEAGAGPPMVQVAPEGDVFGSVFDIVNWTESSGIGAEGASFLESTGVLTNVSGTPSTFWDLIAQREFAYGDCDLVFEWEDTENQVAASLSARIYAYLYLNATNYVWAEHRSRRYSGTYDHLMWRKRINGVSTVLYNINYSGLPSKMRFRIKRVAATNTFTFYTATWNGSSWNSWVQRWSGVIYDATYFNYAHQLKPRSRIIHWATDPTEFTPELGAYFQKTDDGIAAQRFWPDSPEADIKDSVNCGGGESYAFDAAVGKTWSLTGASSVEDGDGGTVRWKVGFSDAADGSGITWDAAWRTIAEVNTNAGNGDYDSHRYLYVKWQGNSDNTQQPNATSFTISGAAVSGIIPSPFGNLNYLLGGVA